MQTMNQLKGVRCRLVGACEECPSGVVISYIRRQGESRRRLTDDSHEGLVAALLDLVRRKGKSWEAQKMTKEEQLKIMHLFSFSFTLPVLNASESQILLGVHGSGFTHLLF
ncbi:hypothetical protein B0H10DRAFT_2356250 [Mycena sp. CBHHK59/15]|nr:hypothetical protein B0H10DRAFT_2356250 [Mycena sp. CBHHK59/15]